MSIGDGVDKSSVRVMMMGVGIWGVDIGISVKVSNSRELSTDRSNSPSSRLHHAPSCANRIIPGHVQCLSADNMHYVKLSVAPRRRSWAIVRPGVCPEGSRNTVTIALTPKGQNPSSPHLYIHSRQYEWSIRV